LGQASNFADPVKGFSSEAVAASPARMWSLGQIAQCLPVAGMPGQAEAKRKCRQAARLFPTQFGRIRQIHDGQLIGRTTARSMIICSSVAAEAGLDQTADLPQAFGLTAS
jgi:hypothetical protein